MSIINNYIESSNKIKLHKLSLDYFMNKDEENYSLDAFIIDCFDNYVILNALEIKDYIKEKERDMIIKELVLIIQSRMSQSLMIYIGYTYNQKILPEIIVEKVTLLVTKYIIDHNIDTD